MSGEVLDHKKASQWTDEGTYKQPKDADNIRVPRLEVDDATTYIDKDGSNNMTFTDAVTGTKTLAQLGAGGTDADAIHDNVANEITAIAEKASPVNADVLVIEDSAASYAKKKVQITNLPAGTPGADSINDTHIDWGAGANQVDADDVPESATKKWAGETGATADQVASEVEVEELGTATYDDVQDYINFFGDRTILSGGTITDNGNGTAAIASLTGWCKETDSDTAVGKFFDWASPGNTAALTDLTTNYVYIDYNGGTLVLVVSTSILTHGFKLDHILIGTIFRNGSTLHWHQHHNIGIERANVTDMHHLEEALAHRASGLITSDGGSLSLSISTGVIYEGVDRQPTTVNGSTWSYWYTSDSGSTWTEDTGQSALVQSYNNIASGKVSLGTGKFGVHWVYVDIDGTHLQIVYGQGNYTANQAEEAAVPSVLPNIITNYGVLIAKIINQEGSNTLTISYPWTSAFKTTLATDHNSLANVLAADTTLLGHVIVEAASKIDVDGSGKLTLGSHGSGHADGTDDVTDLVGDSGSGGTHGLTPAPGAGDAAAGKFLKADGVWTAPAGGGDVAGPGSSTDNAIVRFHETSGKVIQDYTSNPPTISDTGDVNIDGDLDVENIVVSGNVDGKDVSTLGVGDVTGPASSTDNEIARQHSTTGKILQTYTSNPPTISDTGDMNIDGDLDVENIVASGNVDGRDVSADGTKLDNIVSNTQAITHAITDNKTVTVDGTTNVPVNGDYAKWTANGLEGKDKAGILSDLNVEDGADATDATNVNTAGAVMESDGISVSNDGTKTTIAGTAGDYNRIGNAGVTDHSLNSEDDLLITGELEVDGDAAFDGPTITFGINTNVHILGKVTLAENAPIVLDSALSADTKYSGIVEAGVAGATLNFGDCIYQVASDAQWELAKADAAATSDGKLGINVSIAQKSAGNAIDVLLWGKVRSDADYAFSVRRPVFISAATAGDLTSTAPTGTTNFVVRIAGYGNTADELFFCPDNSYVELA